MNNRTREKLELSYVNIESLICLGNGDSSQADLLREYIVDTKQTLSEFDRAQINELGVDLDLISDATPDVEALQRAISKWKDLGFDVAANAFAEKLSKVEKDGRVVCLSFDMNEDVKETLATSMFGKRNSPEECVRCHKVPVGFKDRVSEKEWGITGFCQDCQDFVFNVSEESGDE